MTSFWWKKLNEQDKETNWYGSFVIETAKAGYTRHAKRCQSLLIVYSSSSQVRCPNLYHWHVFQGICYIHLEKEKND
jgi:hypothetical protein